MSTTNPSSGVHEVLLRVQGLVAQPRTFTFAELCALPSAHQITDVGQLDARRTGQAVKLSALLQAAGIQAAAQWLTLHATHDDFHASVPLAAVYDRAVLIYRLHDEPLTRAVGGPLRFLVPDHAACHTAEVDECANVKYVDALELTAERGYDNRPTTEVEHARLHEPS